MNDAKISLDNIFQYLNLNIGEDARARAFKEAFRCTQYSKTTTGFVSIVRSLYEKASSDISAQAYYDILWYALRRKPD